MINRLYKLREKREKFLNHLHFLLECKRTKLVPNFIRIKCNLKLTRNVQKALGRAQISLIRSVIKDTRSRLASIEKELYDLHLSLGKADVFAESQFQFHEQRSWVRAKKLSEIHRAVQRRKLALLRETSIRHHQPSRVHSQSSVNVVNLSDVQLTEDQKHVLDYGFNFALVKKPSVPRIIAPIESALSCSKISPGQKETLRYLIADSIASNTKIRKSNLSKDEKKAIDELQRNKNIVITKADKGGKTVVLAKEKYVADVEKLLDEGPYALLKRDRLSSQIKEVHSAVKKTVTLTETKKKSLIPSYALTPRFYALPKVHKPELSYRPIVSKINSPTYNLSKYLVSIFSSLRSSNCYTVNNSTEFVKKLLSQSADNILMVSFDVKSLFTCVPVDGALRCLKTRLAEFHFTSQEIDELIGLTEVCVKHNTFIFNGKFYQQTSGLAMGDPLSPVLSDLYMHYFECKLLDKLKFPFYVRYVDDTFALWPGLPSDLQDTLSIMNSVDHNIQFTVELEENGSLPFLDVLVTKFGNGFTTKVFRKACSIARPPHKRSNHTFQQKTSGFSAYVHRAINLCSDLRSYQEELDHLRDVAVSRGFNSDIIDQIDRKMRKKQSGTLSTLQPIVSDNSGTVFLPLNQQISYKIAGILSKFKFKVIFIPDHKISFSGSKDAIPDEYSFGIYSIPCECGKLYIGQTRRYLKLRIAEHARYVKNQELTKSTIARHSWDMDHGFKFQEAKIILKSKRIDHLNILESYIIHDNIQNLVNDDSSTPPISPAWKNLISFLHQSHA